MVGELGPELVHLPGGSRVVNAADTAMLTRAGRGGPAPLPAASDTCGDADRCRVERYRRSYADAAVCALWDGARFQPCEVVLIRPMQEFIEAYDTRCAL